MFLKTLPSNPKNTEDKTGMQSTRGNQEGLTKHQEAKNITKKQNHFFSILHHLIIRTVSSPLHLTLCTFQAFA